MHELLGMRCRCHVVIADIARERTPKAAKRWRCGTINSAPGLDLSHVGGSTGQLISNHVRAYIKVAGCLIKTLQLHDLIYPTVYDPST